MSNLQEYLHQKRAALHLLRDRDPSQLEPIVLKVRASAEGRSGIRRIRIRQHQVISDSPSDFAGYDLGPASPELLLGSLSSCLTHIFLIQASDLQIPLDSLEVEVQGLQDPRAGRPGYEDTPIYPHDIQYRVEIESPAAPKQIAELYAAVQRACPVLQLLNRPQTITGQVVHNGTSFSQAEIQYDLSPT